MKKLEFSKFIVALIVVTYILSVIFAAAIMWRVETTDGLVPLIASTGGNLATIVSFYMWKAKNENILKITGKKKLSLEDISKINTEDM